VTRSLPAVACALLLGSAALAEEKPVGDFTDHFDVGTVLHPGSATFDAATKTYTVTGSGTNMWFAKDDCHFAWKKMMGEISIAAEIAFLGTGKDPHRKACLMIRQTAETDSPYVDVAVHGDGMTSLQFRDAKGAATHEVQTNVKAPTRVKLEMRGKYALLYVAAEGEELAFSGAAVRIALDGPVMVGLAVCAHNKDVSETATFANVKVGSPEPSERSAPRLYSTLETQSLNSTDRKVVHVTQGRFEAPNWLKDGQTLIYNMGGKIYKIPAAGGTPTAIDTGFAARCNNDHGLSPDGKTLVISDQTQGDRRSRVYTLPIEGGTPKLITPNAPSYWHGWSPDGKTLVFTGQRDGNFDIYSIPVDGGTETRLTTAPGTDDGPEYSPDGKVIYFNSDRTGQMHLWKMKPDGSSQEQLTDDDANNWFPHPSPDGKVLVFLSYEKDVKGHPENKDVMMRRMNLETKKIDVLGKFFGGQGTVNVPCFSPDGKRIAFVTYQFIP
jgi:Tol biopolymer transport system component